jgi:predicted PurR-regulated permease PerM
MLLTGIFLILLTAALHTAARLLLPIALAVLFTFLLAPTVRFLRRRGLPVSVGAALVVFGTLAIVGAGAGALAGPAADWVASTPKTLVRVQSRIRRLVRPLQATADKVDQATGVTSTVGGPPTVQIKTPGLLQRVGLSTASLITTVGTVAFLTYFLLAMLPTFPRKLANLIESRAGIRDAEAALTEIESQMSRFMVINTLTSVGVGLATWGLTASIGLPHARLWGAAALLLNFIPYAGSVITAALIGAAALVTFETTGPVLLAVGGCVAIQTIEANLITPHLMGRHLPLNPVAIFVSLLYWGWVWGAVGAILAVPITVMLQVVAARVNRLHSLAVLLQR